MVAGREETPSDVKATERLKHYWAEGEGAAKIGWGVPGDFDRCVRHMVDHGYMTDDTAKGYCANLHHRATGGWPGHAPGVEEAMARMKHDKSLDKNSKK